MIKHEKINFNGHSIVSKSAGTGKNAIIFIHGNSLSADSWLAQLNDEYLSNRYCLIAVDLPGHGLSDSLKEDPTLYQMQKMAGVVEAVLNFYKPDNYILAGLSFGTNIIGEISQPLPGCRGIVLASADIISNDVPPPVVFTGIPLPPINIQATATDEEIRLFADSMILQDRNLVEAFVKSYSKTDPNFRVELGKTLLSGGWSDELQNITNWNVPVCVLFGKEEQFINIDYLDGFSFLWNKEVIIIENSGHLVNEEQPAAFNKVLSTFAAEIFG